MNRIRYVSLFAGVLCALCVAQSHAYDSGSTGADGTLTPVEDTVVELPADGVLNYTMVNIPTGVTVSFKKNTANTPVRMLVSGDVVVAGTLSVAGGHAPPVGPAGDGNTADDGNPGTGGPGGYDGGRGGRVRAVGDTLSRYSAEDALAVSGEWGHGPGGGGAGRVVRSTSGNYFACSAINGIFSPGGSGSLGSNSLCHVGGRSRILSYGTSTLLPLVGGSGGGGGRAIRGVNGPGGGGGGGAILIAASGAVNITGIISAVGGNGGWARVDDRYESGSGSGGAIRIIATTVSGTGGIYTGGGRGSSGRYTNNGRVRIETERLRFTGRSDPQYLLGRPGSLYLENRPSVRIVSVGTQSVPAQSSGGSDVSFAEAVTEDVSISIAASHVPLETVVVVNVVPIAGTLVKVNSTPLAGSVASSTASATVALSAGQNVIQAVVSFEVQPTDTAAQSMYTPYTDGELVAQVSLGSGTGAEMTLVTVSGRTIVVPATSAIGSGELLSWEYSQ